MCENEKCVGGYVRKFKGRNNETGELASFYDEVCPDCKGQTEPLPVNNLLDKIAEIIKQADELPF